MMRLNSELVDTCIRGMFVTMVIGKLDPRAGSLEMINAGHLPTLVIHGRDVQSLTAQTPPLGILQDVRYNSMELQLRGGVMYLYSDGIIECRDDHGDELNIKGFLKILLKVHAMPLAERITHLKNYFSELPGPQRDDITLLALEN